MSDRPTVRERLSRIETEVKFLREDISELKTDLSDFKTVTVRYLVDFERRLNDLHSLVDNHSSLSGKEKAAIIVALITSISSIVVALIQTLVH